MLIYAMAFISLALIFYSIGVWSEKIQGKLKIWHLIFFYLGLVCDAIGTWSMRNIASGTGTFASDSYFHEITGALALSLMLVHALWATFVLIKKDDLMINKFHKFSIFVWVTWLIPFISGFVFSLF